MGRGASIPIPDAISPKKNHTESGYLLIQTQVSRVETKDIGLVDFRLGRLHSCLQSSIGIRKYCDAHHKRHMLPLCETMQVARRHEQRFDFEMKSTPRLPRHLIEASSQCARESTKNKMSSRRTRSGILPATTESG
jgi:hypothetical protein